jgi:hypothetical protein
MLSVSKNRLRSLPDEMSCLVNLRELGMRWNRFTQPPISVLRHLTALTSLEMSPFISDDVEGPRFRIPAPLLPILHPGLVSLELQPFSRRSNPFRYDPLSLFHLGHAMAELAKRRPLPTLSFKEKSF